jgi:hypothetical protein
MAALLAVLLLELSTGCSRTASAAAPAGTRPNPGLVFISVLMVVVGVFLLLQVGRVVGRIFALATQLAQAFASIMLVLAVAAGAVILAVFALAT